jgi:hypothetical protein
MVGENTSVPIQPDAKRQQRSFPGLQSACLNRRKWWGLLLLPVLSAILVYAYPFELHGKVSPTPVRRHPIPKPKTANPNLLGDKAYRIAVHYFNKHQKRIKNKRYLTVIDYTKPSDAKRMSIIDLKTHKIEKHLVAHGKNSGTRRVNNFSNRLNSYKSCKGLFLTGNTYVGTHGKSLKLLGLERGINDHALERGIVIHGAPYVSNKSVELNGGFLGRSWGCPAVPVKEVDQIVGKIKNGSLLYIHGTS